MEQNEFLTKVHDLIDQAAAGTGIITEEEMLKPFAGEKLDKTQIEAIRTFLSANGVKVSGLTEKIEEKNKESENTSAGSGSFAKTASNKAASSRTADMNRDAAPKARYGRGSAAAPERKKMVSASMSGVKNLTSQEQKIYNSYLQEMELLERYEEAEEAELFARKCAGDADARNRLTEGNLHHVVRIAADYAGRGVSISDLVQEGNMELIMLIDESDGSTFRDELDSRIGKAMEMLVMESDGNDSFKDRLAMLANKLLEIQEELERDQKEGKDVSITVEDLAERLRVTPDEIQTVMRMSISAADLEESGFGGE